jgi:UDP-GlcNAc:undecaprenyl-phosphate/decaprenyl-phosphate GlcNAc-1-phosphate transferase
MMAASRLLAPGTLFFFACALSLGGTPVARRVAIRIGLLDHPAPRKHHREPVPYLGGAAICLSTVTLILAVAVIEHGLRVKLLVVASGAAAMAAMGLVDDWRTMQPITKLVLQAGAAFALWAAGLRLHATGISFVDLALTILVVLAITNAVNLLDNMDGLSSGTVSIAAFAFFVAGWWLGQDFVWIVGIVLAGACLGFLPYNLSPARIFLGDAGTLLMGFLVSSLVLGLHLPDSPAITRAAVPLMIVAVPLFDMALVVVSRRRAGRPVSWGGRDHSSHRIAAMGATEAQVALITYAAGLLAAFAALVLVRSQSSSLTWVLLTSGLFAAALAGWFLEVRVELIKHLVESPADSLAD